MSATDGSPASRRTTGAEEHYQDLLQAFLGCSGVTRDGTGFGSGALKVGGRMFASLSRTRQLIVKLPRARVDALVAGGEGVRFDPGRGRLMKEWLAVSPSSHLDWEALVAEALRFVSAGSG